MEFANKTMIRKDKKLKGIAAIAILCAVACASVVLGILSIVDKKYIFSIVYLVALMLSILYTVMKINIVMPTFIANDEENLYMRYWNNGFFAFRIDKGFFGEFIPEKIKSSKITLNGIVKVCVGTGKFISRILPESSFAAKISEQKGKYLKMIKKTEFIHFTLASGKERYMPITDFDYETLSDIIKDIQRVNANLNFTTANRKLKKLVMNIKNEKEEL